MMSSSGRTNIIQDAPIQKILSDVTIPSNVISLGQGIPFFGPPKESIEVASNSLNKENVFKYSEDAGLLSFRNVISNKLKNENHFITSPTENIMVTMGANHAFINTIFTITNVGDNVILLSPYYFNHLMAIQLAGCKPIIIDTDDNFQPIIDNILESITHLTKAIITISPNNPTGAVYPKKVLKEINQICSDNGIYHISDEVYEYYLYNGAEHISSSIFDNNLDHTISIYSFSKSFGMAGYRIGYMVFPSDLYSEILKVQDTIGICPPVPSQIAAENAIKIGYKYFKEFLSEITEIREIFIDELNNIGYIDLKITKGGCYFIIKLKTKKSSMKISKKLIEEYGVITVPGEVFGIKKPSLRVSYGNIDREASIEGIRRIKKGLSKII